jgi:hypothetical protein
VIDGSTRHSDELTANTSTEAISYASFPGVPHNVPGRSFSSMISESDDADDADDDNDDEKEERETG